jgi:hypothetical protein
MIAPHPSGGSISMSKRPPNHPSDRGRWNPPPETGADRLSSLAETARLRLGEHPWIRADPPDRKDGRCAHCRGERPEVAVKNGDPFCSTACARGWHDQLEDISSSRG